MLKLILLAAVAACIAAQTFQDIQNQLNQPQDYPTAPAVGQDPANAIQPQLGYPYPPPGYAPGYPYAPVGSPFFQQPGLGSGSHGGKSKKHKHGGKSKKHKHGGKSNKHKHGGKSRKGSGGKSGKKGKKDKKGKKNNGVLGMDPFVQDPSVGLPVPQVVP